jgi:hypothetical protein
VGLYALPEDRLAAAVRAKVARAGRQGQGIAAAEQSCVGGRQDHAEGLFPGGLGFQGAGKQGGREEQQN